MMFVMFILVAGFVAVVIYLAKIIVLDLEHQADEDVFRAEAAYQTFIQKKNEADTERRALQAEADRIFTLYDMTKEITKKQDEEEAFQIFKRELAKYVEFEECRFVDDAEQLEEVPAGDQSLVFPLESKRRSFGYLVCRGVREEDKENFIILAHQFALALRRIKLYKEIEHLAITDTLTQVHTRRYFYQRMDEELVRAQAHQTSITLVMIDVDHFKRFNDDFGHLTGDQILRDVSAAIKESIREIDFVGRYGGEEFCVVLPETDIGGAAHAAERIRTAVEGRVIRAFDRDHRVTVSIGLACYPKDGQAAEELIDKADWALYRAKKLGRNRVCAFGVYSEGEQPES